MRGRKHPLAEVKKWRAKDRHTGIERDGRVRTPTVPQRADSLDAFFQGWGEHATIVVDVRPLTAAEALEELRRFPLQADAARKGTGESK